MNHPDHHGTPITATAYRYGDHHTGEWTPDCIAHLVAFILNRPRNQISDDDVLATIGPQTAFDDQDGKFDIYLRDGDHWPPTPTPLDLRAPRLSLGQWVIRGATGHTYVCDHDVLHATYTIGEAT